MAIKPITIKGQQKAEGLLRRYGEKAERAMEIAGFEEATEIIDASQPLVPVNFGTLKNSWGIQTLRSFLSGSDGARFTMEPPGPGDIVIGGVAVQEAAKLCARGVQLYSHHRNGDLFNYSARCEEKPVLRNPPWNDTGKPKLPDGAKPGTDPRTLL